MSPRLGGAGPRQRKSTVGSLIALALILIAAPCQAQSAAAAPVDTLVPTEPDSTVAPTSSAPPAPPPAPVDSALGAACAETGGDPPDLLLVTFRSSSSEAERAAVARELGGTLLGPSVHAAPGSWYLRVPGSAGDRSVADRLILLSPVLEVGTTRCPS